MKHKILIVGGGFGGIKSALVLSQNPQLQVTLVSDQENFRYYPTLYRAATGSSITASSIPLSEIFANKNIKIIKGSVIKLDKDNKTITLQDGKSIKYDDLILSLGVVTNYFGIDGLAKYSYGIKTNEDAKRLRDHLHDLIADQGKPDLNYIVIGGGPTGVELAGALPEYLKHIMKMHGAENKSVHIDLVEATPHLMPRMKPRYSNAVEKRLKKLGVKLILNKKVESEYHDSLIVSGHSIKSHTVIWTAGVTNHPFFKDNGFKLSDHGKVIVNSYLQSSDNIYVIGDNADTPYSGMAQTALYDACYVSNNINRLIFNKQPRLYKPKQPIYITPAGDGWAAVSWGRFSFFGKTGWILRNIADFIAFHDFEPWWKSSKHFIAEFVKPEDCQTCKK